MQNKKHIVILKYVRVYIIFFVYQVSLNLSKSERVQHTLVRWFNDFLYAECSDEAILDLLLTYKTHIPLFEKTLFQSVKILLFVHGIS